MNSDKLKQIDSVKIISAYQNLFNSEPGRVVLEDMAKRYWFYKSMQDINPQIVAHREGERSVICDIKNMLNINTTDLMNQIKSEDQENG